MRKWEWMLSALGVVVAGAILLSCLSLLTRPLPDRLGFSPTEGQLPWADMLHASEPCHHPISVAWIMKDRMMGSHLWSGFDTADNINGNYAGAKRFPDIVCLPLLTTQFMALDNDQLLALYHQHGQPPEKRTLDLCVFLKGYDTNETLTRCRELGATTALIWVDTHPNLMYEGGLTNHTLEEYDHVVVPNTLMSQHYVDALSGRRLWVIPQHNPNVHGLIKTNAAEPVRVVAWQGGEANRMSGEVRDAITEWAKQNPGLEFREIFYKSPSLSRADLEKGRDLAFEHMRDVDVLVIFPPEEKFLFMEVYKPSGRNLFGLSMGIPTILFPYVSYTEDLKWGADYPAFASNIPQLLRWLDILRDSAETRVTLSQMALDWADHFSMDRIARRWAFHIRNEVCGRKRPSPSPSPFQQPPLPADAPTGG